MLEVPDSKRSVHNKGFIAKSGPRVLHEVNRISVGRLEGDELPHTTQEKVHRPKPASPMVEVKLGNTTIRIGAKLHRNL